MSIIAMDQGDFLDGRKKWKHAMERVDKVSKDNKMVLKAKGSDAEFLTNYINAVKELKEVLQAYHSLLENDFDCLVAIQQDMELVDEAASTALSKN